MHFNAQYAVFMHSNEAARYSIDHNVYENGRFIEFWRFDKKLKNLIFDEIPKIMNFNLFFEKIMHLQIVINQQISRIFVRSKQHWIDEILHFPTTGRA